MSFVISIVLAAYALQPQREGAESPRAHHPISAWSDRGVFVFGGLVFDFLYDRYQGGPWGGPISDCSNATYFCMTSRPFNLAVPRYCSTLLAGVKAGDIWRAGPVQTEVLHVDISETVPRFTTLYLGSKTAPGLVYQYETDRGVTMIFYDDPGPGTWNSDTGIDFVAIARAGGMKQWAYGASLDRTKANRMKGLITLDRFGECK